MIVAKIPADTSADKVIEILRVLVDVWSPEGMLRFNGNIDNTTKIFTDMPVDDFLNIGTQISFCCVSMVEFNGRCLTVNSHNIECKDYYTLEVFSDKYDKPRHKKQKKGKTKNASTN